MVQKHRTSKHGHRPYIATPPLTHPSNLPVHPIHPPTNPPTVCSSSAAICPAADALVHTEFIRYRAGDFHFLTIIRMPGAKEPPPGGWLCPPPARRVGHWRRSFAGVTENHCVGRAWHGRGAAGGPVARGRPGDPRGMLELESSLRSNATSPSPHSIR